MSERTPFAWGKASPGEELVVKALDQAIDRLENPTVRLPRADLERMVADAVDAGRDMSRFRSMELNAETEELRDHWARRYQEACRRAASIQYAVKRLPRC